jgi:predicted RNase H-like nuclease
MGLEEIPGRAFLGADGCKAGWLTVLLTENNDWRVDVFPDVSSLWNKYSRVSVILLDVPIGLRERGHEERTCDKKARELLGPKRGPSVFRVPCRSAIYAESHETASNINKQITGRRLPLQTWNIIPKIREIDIFLSNNESARLRVREIHPEICFWALAGHPMKHKKKKPEGRLERTQVLKSICPQTDDIIKHTLSTYRRNKVARDDILDAISAAVTAMVGIQRLVSIPEAPEFDSHGLRMEMVYRPYQREHEIT